MNTPWGPSQQIKTVAPGIVSVSTASHGGLKVSPEVWARIEAAFPGQPTYAPAGWLEEDLDWSLAALACPELFPPRECFFAVRSAEYPGEYFARVNSWIKTAAAAAVKARAALHVAEVQS